jgi:DNA-binding HxlR family transcriptional regulator
MGIEKNVVNAYILMMKALANETRLSILYTLHEKPRKWTDLLFELRVNPKSLRDHLAFLQKCGLVRRRTPVGFELTNAAKAFIEISLEDIIATAKQAADIAGNQSS